MTFTQEQERKQEVFAQALAKLKETRQLSTDLLKPLAIPFENFLRFGQLSTKKQQKTMTSLIAHLEKCVGLPIAYDVENKMEIGSKVSVKTKHYGTKTGTVIEHASFGWIIKPDDHSRNIVAQEQDIKIIK